MANDLAPVVLVHGVGLDHSMWDAMNQHVRVLLPERRVIVYDMLGHGDQPCKRGPFVLADFVTQLHSLLDHHEVSECDLAGFSMGAMVAQGFASAKPTRVRRLALLNSVYDRSESERSAVLARVVDVRSGGYDASIETALQRWFTPSFAASRPDAVHQVRRRLLHNDVGAYANAYQVFATADRELVALATSIACPTLVATGSDDKRSTPEMTQRLAVAVPNGRAVVIDGARHLMPIELPETVARLLTAFFSDEDAQL